MLSGLVTDRFGNRGDDIGQRFGKLKTKLGYGPGLVFHSLRRTVATMLERTGATENVAADILGHEKPRITFGLYSGGSGLAAMAEALGRLRYPAARAAP